MVLYLGRTSTYQKVKTFFSYSMFDNVAGYLKTKKLTNFSERWTSQLSSFSKCNEINSCWRSPFPEDGDLCHSIVCIDEANPVKHKLIQSNIKAVAQSLYKIICCCGCFEIKINRQFVNLVSKELTYHRHQHQHNTQ